MPKVAATVFVTVKDSTGKTRRQFEFSSEGYPASKVTHMVVYYMRKHGIYSEGRLSIRTERDWGLGHIFSTVVTQ